MKYKNKDGIQLNYDGMSEAGRKGSGVDWLKKLLEKQLN